MNESAEPDPSAAARGYLRQPTIAGDRIAFVCDDDLWGAPASGGVAQRLTAGLGEPSTPALSPDGRQLAYASRDEHHSEVYLMAAAGGPARRLTWLGSPLRVRGWSSEGHILFVSPHGQPFARAERAFSIDPQGGLPRCLPFGTASHLSLAPGGAVALGRHTADPARWKRYRGGTAGQLWVDTTGGGQFSRLTGIEGNPTCPMWVGGRLYFLSDFQGVGNLYSCRPDGSDLRRHTDHAEYYARCAASDGTRIVYQCAAELWLFDPSSDRSQPIPLDVPGHRAQAARRFVPAAGYLAGLHVHPQGHSLALEVRGKLFELALWEGAVRQHGRVDGVRYRCAQWLADGETLVAVSDASGEERLEIFEKDGSRRTLDWDLGRVLALRASPRGRQLALSNHRQEILWIDLDAPRCTKIERSEHGRTEQLAWSPDGAWLAYPFCHSRHGASIHLFEVATQRSQRVTSLEFRDWCPSFDPGGRYLYFLSLRTFDPVYDSVQFELSFPRGARPYLIALRADAPPPFEPRPRGLRAEPDGPGSGEPGSGDAGDPEPLRVDLDGIETRVTAFPVPEGRYEQIAGTASDRVVWTLKPIAGAHGRGGHKEDGVLEAFELETSRTRTLLEKVDAFELAGDGHTLVARRGRRLRAIDATRSRDDLPGEARSDEPSRESGWIDLDRVRVSVSPRSEWRQMLREVWRLQRDQFWVGDLSGVDWNGAYARYASLLDRVATRAELSDLIWELQGELGTSHAYEWQGDHREPPKLALGQLAADLQPSSDGAGYRIAHLVQGDPWDPEARSPLCAIGVAARVGDRIVRVNGQPVTREQPPQALLVHQADCTVELVLERDGERRTVIAHTLRDETPARYREWVEHNRAAVHARSGGRLGYFHLPDMGASGFAEFHRYFAEEADRDGLIVDVRHNGGGHVSELLLEKVARRRLGYDVSRWSQPAPYPSAAPAGPVVALTNESAGSDGDIFSHGFKMMKLGPLIGTRTWGGVIGIWPRHRLVDGTETTQPEFSFWFSDVGWGVENHGTEPDIEIDNTPQDDAAGRDAQLERAIEVALAALEQRPPALPDFGPKPSLAPPPLPRRDAGR